MIEVAIDDDQWLRAAPDAENAALEAAGMAAGPWADDGTVTILLTDDAAMRDLSRRFRDRGSATNVLAFPAAANNAGWLGDIALGFGVCRQEAMDQGKSLTDHLRHLVIHGVLHLMGCDHVNAADAACMEARERALLARLGIADPYAESLPREVHVQLR